MNKTQRSTSPFPWVRKLAEWIPEMTEIPLFGQAPPFDWQRLSSLLSARFEAKALSLRPKEQEWREPGAIKTGLGRNPFVASVLLNPLDATLYFAMSRSDANKFLSWMMHGTSKHLVSEPLKEGFSRFLLLEILDAASKIGPLQKLTPQLGETSELPEEPSFCIDIELSYGQSACWGRLILTGTFRKKWIEHFSQTPSEYATSPTALATELIVGIKTGSVLLSQEEWKAVELGDVLVLDQGGYDARKQTGIATLNIGSIPLFQVKIKQNKLNFSILQ
jgi:flagellar motor switch protein FliN